MIVIFFFFFFFWGGGGGGCVICVQFLQVWYEVNGVKFVCTLRQDALIHGI